MDGFIFKNLLNKINNSSDDINTYFKNDDLYNNNIYEILSKIPKYNIIVYIFIIFLIYNFIKKLEIRLNEILVWIICILLIYLLIKKDYTQFIQYTIVKKNQLEFLHKLMFDDYTWDYEKKNNLLLKPINSNNKSYLYLNPLIVEFFYNIREYSQYNISSYVNSLLHTNNVIGFEYEALIGLNNKYDNYEVAIVESKKALNELNYTFTEAIIENQIGPNAIRMKGLQGMITMFFISKGVNVTYWNAANKLKQFTKEKMSYSERKKLSIHITRQIVERLFVTNLEYFNSHKKKDDLSDCFLQLIDFLNKKGIKNINCNELNIKL